MFFDPHISLPEAILLAFNFLCFLFLIIFYRNKIRRIWRRVVQCQNKRGDDLDLPNISVIVFDRDSVRNLAETLKEILSQDYPSKIEVIVVSDGRSETIEDIVKNFAVDYPHLRYTFVPDKAQFISRKKLAISLGIKAAKYDYVVITDADCVINSRNWLRNISRNFKDKKEVVIGFCRQIDEKNRCCGSYLRSFDILADDIVFLAYAIKRKPYRGFISNIGFKKQLYFDKKGFSDALGFHNGEDDIFINRIAKRDNSVVELSTDSQLVTRSYDFKRQHKIYKLSHLFTGKYTRKSARRFWGASSFAMWLSLFLIIATVCLSLPNLFAPSISAALFLGWLIPVVFTWKKTAASLSIRFSGWLCPLLLFWHPIFTFIYKIKARFHKNKNFTWARPMK